MIAQSGHLSLVEAGRHPLVTQHVKIHTGTEGPTGAPHQHDADLRIGGDRIHDRGQSFDPGQIFGVQDLGSVEGYGR
jgi:hypothetical protein